MESELTRWKMNRKCQVPHKRASDKTREAAVGERRRGTVGDSWGEILARNNLPVCPKEAAAVGGRGRANLAGGRLGGPLSPRAGRVAKEMTARSAAPRRAGRAGFEAAPFPLPLPLCSGPVTATWAASRLSPAPCVGRAAGPTPATRAPGAPAPAPARVALRSPAPEAAGQPPPWVPTSPSPTR